MDDQATHDALRRGLSALERGDAEEARAVLDSTGQARLPDAASVQAYAALALRLGRPEVARSRLRREIRRFSRDARLRLLLGRALEAEGQLPAAAGALRDALRLEPDGPDAAYNLAGVLERQGRVDEALSILRIALDRHGGDADLWNQLGLVQAALDDRDAALEAHRRAHALEPEDPGLALNLGLELLTRERWDEGWPLFEHRLDRAPGLQPPRASTRWRGEPLNGRRLLVWNEQGLGDTLFAARWIPRLAERGARIVLRVPPALRRLLGELEGVTETIEPGDTEPPVDLHVPLLSLPGLLGVGPDDAPPAGLVVDGDIPPIEGPRPHVGLVWAGNPAHTRDRERSIPARRLRPLLDTPGATFVALQYGPAADALHHRRLFAPGPTALGDFSRTAGWMERLDVIVTVDTAAAHLAGSLGRTVWTLLSRPADWRWGARGESTRWYPTMRLHRQETPTDWSGPLAAVRRGLESWSPEGEAAC